MAVLVDKTHESDSVRNSTLSLSHLPPNSHDETRRHLSPTPDLIDFSFPIPPTSDDTYAADEVFHHGRLLPFKNFHPPQPANRVEAEKLTIRHFNHRRAGSLDGCTRRPRGEAQTADFQRLRRASSDPRPTPATGTSQKLPLFVLGSVRIPAEMGMQDIRSRQRRRGPPQTAEEIAFHGRRRSRWGILRALSCKAAENTAISPVRATS